MTNSWYYKLEPTWKLNRESNIRGLEVTYKIMYPKLNFVGLNDYVEESLTAHLYLIEFKDLLVQENSSPKLNVAGLYAHKILNPEWNILRITVLFPNEMSHRESNIWILHPYGSLYPQLNIVGFIDFRIGESFYAELNFVDHQCLHVAYTHS